MGRMLLTAVTGVAVMVWSGKDTYNQHTGSAYSTENLHAALYDTAGSDSVTMYVNLLVIAADTGQARVARVSGIKPAY
jgi:hypothetical protein